MPLNVQEYSPPPKNHQRYEMKKSKKNLSLKRGDLVRMSRAYKEKMNNQVIPGILKNPKHRHPSVKEFGRCVGVVQGTINWPDGQIGPEVDVRWKRGAQLMYSPDELQIVKRS